MVGLKDKKLFVYSHASVTNTGEFPIRILPPMESSIPPRDMVGSMPALTRISDTIDEVVVFP